MRTPALKIYDNVAQNELASLAEVYGEVIEAVRAKTITTALKNNNLSGDPGAGSVEAKRPANSIVQAYGTARTAGHGDALTIVPITVNLDQHKEIVEEIEGADIDEFGVPNLVARRAANHVDSVVAKLERDFLDELNGSAQAFTPTGSDLQAQLEQFIVTLETVQNNFVDGVERGDMDILASPTFYSQIRDLLDAQSNPNVDTAAEEFGIYHGVRVYSAVRMPAGVNAFIERRGIVAQPVVIKQYSEPSRIPLSQAFEVSLFADYGTKNTAYPLISNSHTDHNSDLAFRWLTTTTQNVQATKATK